MYTLYARSRSSIRVRVPTCPPAALVETPNHSRRAEICVAGELGLAVHRKSSFSPADAVTLPLHLPRTCRAARTQSWDSLVQKSDCIIPLPNHSRSNRYIGERKSARTREIRFGPTTPRASVTNTSPTSDGHLARLWATSHPPTMHPAISPMHPQTGSRSC
jgi:hypothetical protein